MLSCLLLVSIDMDHWNALSASRRQELRSTRPPISSCPKVRRTPIHAEIKHFHPGTADRAFVINGK